MNELMTRVFENEEFGQVRTIVENGEVLFCGLDVAVALGYTNPRKAIRDHTKGGTKRSSLTAGGNQEIIFIPEGDVYRLIAHSRLDSAIRFEHWVFDEVLPTLRKTGMYAMLPQDYPSALRALADSVEERLRLEAKIEEDRPKVEFAEAVSGASGYMLVGDFAKLLQQSGADTSPRKFFTRLRNDHYLMRYGGNNIPTQEAISMGVLAVREYVVHLPGGGTAVNFTPLVTPKGQRHFMEKYGGNAYVRNDL